MDAAPVYTDGELIPGTIYQVVKCLGMGGMGTVYLVEDMTVGRRYVLKTLHPALVRKGDYAELLRAEARTVAQMHHENIVEVFTAGRTADAHAMPFFVMEYLDGIPLRMIMGSPLPGPHVRQLATELLEALEYLHTPDDGRPVIIHRDIKPENVFLAKNSKGRYVLKVLDFGIMTFLDGQRPKQVYATLRYAAPEQLQRLPATPQTDLYAVGCVVFEMLTGRHPFATAETMEEMIGAHLYREAPRVSQFVRVPRRVDDIIAAALSKQPERRPVNAQKFILALQELRHASGNDPRASALANTTIEDLHTAILKNSEGAGAYEIYATTNEHTFDGQLEGATIEDAFPPLHFASTEPRSAPETWRGAHPTGFRSAPNGLASSPREGSVRRRAGKETEDLLDGYTASRRSAERPRAEPSFRAYVEPASARSIRAEQPRRTNRRSVSSTMGASSPLAETIVPTIPTTEFPWAPLGAGLAGFAAVLVITFALRRDSASSPRAAGQVEPLPSAQVAASAHLTAAPATAVTTVARGAAPAEPVAAPQPEPTTTAVASSPPAPTPSARASVTDKRHAASPAPRPAPAAPKGDATFKQHMEDDPKIKPKADGPRSLGSFDLDPVDF